MADFEKEHCTGCRFFLDRHHPNGDGCAHKDADSKYWPDRHDQCDFFVPSELCRGVRALESIYDVLRDFMKLKLLKDDE